MLNLTDLASMPGDPPAPFTDRLRLAVAAYLAASRAPHARTPSRTCAATWPGAPSTAWTRWPPSGRTWSCTSGRCRRSAASSPPPSPAGSPSRPGSTGPASWTASWSTHPPSTSAVPQLRPDHRPWGSLTCSSRRCSPLPGLREPVRLRPGGHARPAGLADLRGHRRGYRRSRRGTWSPRPAGVRQGHQGGPGPAAASGRPWHRPGSRLPGSRADPAAHPRHPDGPARSHPPPSPACRKRGHPESPGRTAIPTTSSPPTWPPVPDPARVSRGSRRGTRPTLPK